MRDQQPISSEWRINLVPWSPSRTQSAEIDVVILVDDVEEFVEGDGGVGET